MTDFSGKAAAQKSCSVRQSRHLGIFSQQTTSRDVSFWTVTQYVAWYFKTRLSNALLVQRFSRPKLFRFTHGFLACFEEKMKELIPTSRSHVKFSHGTSSSAENVTMRAGGWWKCSAVLILVQSGAECTLGHSRPQSPRSFWFTAGIESSGNNHFRHAP